MDVDVDLPAPQRPHTDTWLCRDARGCNGGIREELAEGVRRPGPPGATRRGTQNVLAFGVTCDLRHMMQAFNQVTLPAPASKTDRTPHS
jgi:hypothetical protein